MSKFFSSQVGPVEGADHKDGDIAASGHDDEVGE